MDKKKTYRVAIERHGGGGGSGSQCQKAWIARRPSVPCMDRKTHVLCGPVYSITKDHS